jgi:hypothetical protein
VRIVVGQVPAGFTASLLITTFLSGIQLLFLGIIGEYWPSLRRGERPAAACGRENRECQLMDPEYSAAYARLYREHWWWRVREEILLKKSVKPWAAHRTPKFSMWDAERACSLMP